MRTRPRTKLLVGLLILTASFAIIVGLTVVHQPEARTIQLTPKSRTEYWFTFEIPNDLMEMSPGVTRRATLEKIAPGIFRGERFEESYRYVFADGQTGAPKGAEVYSHPTTNINKELYVWKPAAGVWRFQLHRTIKRRLIFPFLNLDLADRVELWQTDFFTNEVRPASVLPGSPNNPFE